MSNKLAANNKKTANSKTVNRKNTEESKNKTGLIIAVALVAVVVIALAVTLSGGLSHGKGGKHHVEIEVQDYGTIVVELDADAAPITVENFIKLAKEGFYDGLTFHRVMDGFMIQGGDPDGNGTGGSKETIKGEFASNGVENPLKHERGTISMARSSNNMDSASSQFFIVQETASHLDGSYAAFGSVTDGMDVVDRICKEATGQDENGVLPAENQPVITKITVID